MGGNSEVPIKLKMSTAQSTDIYDINTLFYGTLTIYQYVSQHLKHISSSNSVTAL